jgi:hypothetical protein
MAIIIGAATEVSFAGTCVISANWGYNPNAQRLYCIGEWTPREDLTFYRPTQTLNLTVYAPGPTYSTEPTTSCADANSVAASVSPAACGGSVGGDVSGSWLVTSYSYSKEDASMPGQESWSLIKYKDVPTPSSGNSIEPTYVMRGISEGQSTGTETGVSLTGGTAESTTGSVSAGGFGRADTVEAGVVDRVGGGSSSAGDTGQGSASMPYTPLYI